jgi:chemotaxis protein MotB
MARISHRGRESTEPATNPNAWMITFADLCTLLLSFFVLLFSMSSLNARAFRSTFQSFSKATGILELKAEERIALRPYQLVRDLCKNLADLEKLDVVNTDKIRQADHINDRDAQRMISGHAIWYQELENEVGFSFILGQQLLFESGQAVLNPKAHPILDKLAKFMKAGLYSIYIDGHTDDVPIHNERFPSNEELSLARAEAVMEYLVVNCGVNPRLFALGGYGSSHPMVSDVTGAQMALNRRVELIFHWNPA